MSNLEKQTNTAEEDAFLILYDQVREKWLVNDPYMRDPDGFMDEVNRLWDEHDKELEKEKEEKAREFESWMNTPWRKTLLELAPRHTSLRLEDRIYKEILIKGEQFTPEKKDEYKDTFELLWKLRFAQQNFEKEKGEYMDMFGEYIMETGRLTSSYQALTPMNIVKFMCSVIIGDDVEVIRSLNDPTCGTGRFMLGCAQHYREKGRNNNFIFFNQDIDYKMYVYTAFNAILHDIPSITVLGDSIALEKREAILTIPWAKGFTTWRIFKENIGTVEAALLAGIEQLATQT